MTMKRTRLICSTLACLTSPLFAADLILPSTAIAGQGVEIRTSGSGAATLYIVGPGTAIRRQIKLGNSVQIKGEDLRAAGYYEIALSKGASQELYIAPAAP